MEEWGPGIQSDTNRSDFFNTPIFHYSNIPAFPPNPIRAIYNGCRYSNSYNISGLSFITPAGIIDGFRHQKLGDGTVIDSGVRERFLCQPESQIQ